MEFKGTQGEWFIDGDKWIVTDDKSEYGDIICAPPEEWDLSMINWEANALLISKAPEMLDFLIRLRDEWRHDDLKYGGESYHMKDITNLIKEATTL